MNFSFDILSQIASGSNMFSKTEMKLAEYILADPSHILNLSISELAAACGVSLATVSRFCKRLSLNGYQEFRLELMKSVSSAQEGSASGKRALSSDDSIVDLLQKVNSIHQDALSKALTALNSAHVKQAVDLMENAKDVHFFGCGSMLLVAMSAKLQFMQISTKFHCELDPPMQALSASLMNENSVAVIFSYTGSTRDIVEIAKMAKTQNAKIISISRYSQSPLADLSDIVLICGVNEGPFQAGSASVQTSLLYIIDVLYTEYFRRTPDESQRNKEKTSVAVIGKLRPLKTRGK